MFMFNNRMLNLQSVTHALQWLHDVVGRRMDQYLQGTPFEMPLLEISGNGNPLMDYATENNLDADEFLLLLIALAPHIQPSFFDSIIREFLPGGGDFPDFGGVRGANHRGILPTGETAQLIIAGNDIVRRTEVQELFDEDHFFFRRDILWLETVREGEPIMSGRMVLSAEWLNKFMTGEDAKPRFGPDFPAKRLETQMTWSDLVLHPYTADQILDIKRWLYHQEALGLDENLSRKIKPGFRVLFYGPPGTGKTLTASLLGREFNKEVYRIDLSQIVSKFIGETEKNLGKVFDRAEHRNWILFFDEADALFGKRTNVQSSHDKYANQEVSFLLQRVEDFNGLLILASNFKANLDDAFLRRFHSVIHFPLPNVQERIKLWEKALPASIPLESAEIIPDLARSYEVTGAAILNIIQYASLKSLSREGENILRFSDIMEGLKKEFRKEDKSVI